MLDVFRRLKFRSDVVMRRLLLSRLDRAAPIHRLLGVQPFLSDSKHDMLSHQGYVCSNLTNRWESSRNINHQILDAGTGRILSAYVLLPIPVTARSKTWFCDRSLSGNAGSNPAEGIDICLLWVLCVVRYRSLTSVVCLTVIVNPP